MDREAFRSQVATHMTGLVSQVSTFLNTYGTEQESGLDSGAVKMRLVTYAEMYSTLLEEPSQQERAAYNLCAAMFGSALPDREFWTTEAGQAIALAIGFPRPDAPRTHVEKILGVSRQRVAEMIGQEILDAVDSKHVTAASVRDRLRDPRHGRRS